MSSFQALLAAADNLAQLTPPARAQWENELVEFVGQDASRLSAVLAALRPAARSELAAKQDKLMLRLLARVPPAARLALGEPAVDALSQLYRRLENTDLARQQILRLMAADGSRRALAAFAELLASDPPQGNQDAALAFVPLFQSQQFAAEALFPRLLACLEHPALAGIVLDLANYLYRKGLASKHPAAERVAQLAQLMQNLVQRLGRIEEQPQEFAGSPPQLNRIVGDSVALVVSLCDALALIGDPAVTPKLYQALELHHRRVRTEAAAALVRLGDEAGLETLIAMTAEPVVRSRALHYLEELNMLDRVPANRASPAARAEGALAAWLAEPAHVGLPPRSLELVDARRQFWPGFHTPLDCYLFRFEYRIGESVLTGIGIAGPVTHAFMCDLQDYSPDDIYAAYAGWFAEHAEIRQTPAESLSAAEHDAWLAEIGPLEAAGYRRIELVLRGEFFGRVQWVATAQRQDRPGCLVVDDSRVSWYPQPPARHPPGAAEAYYIHKGRELLRTFNTEQ